MQSTQNEVLVWLGLLAKQQQKYKSRCKVAQGHNSWADRENLNHMNDRNNFIRVEQRLEALAVKWIDNEMQLADSVNTKCILCLLPTELLML